MEHKLRFVNKTANHGTLEKLWTELPLCYSMLVREELKFFQNLFMSGLVQTKPVRESSSVTVQIPGQVRLKICHH